MENRSTTRSSSLRGRLGVILLGLLVVGVTVVYSTIQFGKVRGVEFSPQTFKRREFGYREIPLIKLQITPIRRSDATGSLADLVRKKKMIQPVAKAATRWDLVRADNGASATRGDAEILCNYLDLENDDGDVIWLEWTKRHPKSARILWPAVAELARQELYIFIPDLISLAAEQALGSTELKQKIDDTLSQRYCELGQAQQALGRHDLAVELFSSAIARDSSNAPAWESRAASHSALGQIQKAQSDRRKAAAIQDDSQPDKSQPPNP